MKVCYLLVYQSVPQKHKFFFLEDSRSTCIRTFVFDLQNTLKEFGTLYFGNIQLP